MKKLILFSLLFVAGLQGYSSEDYLNGEEVAAPKSTIYEDVKKVQELSLRLHKTPENAQKSLEMLNESMKIAQALFAEVSICEQAGNCESSEELERLLKEFSKIQLIFIQKGEEAFDKPERKELKEIYSKHSN